MKEHYDLNKERKWKSALRSQKTVMFQLKTTATVMITVVINWDSYFNDHRLGSYEITNTENDNGEKWNRFKCSGEIGKPDSLSEGKHKIVVAGEKVDFYGVELDYVLLELDCASNQTTETSDCPVGLISITQEGGSDDSCDGSDSNSGKTSILGIPEIVGIVVSICTLVIATLGFCFGVYKWKHRNKNNYLQIQHYA